MLAALAARLPRARTVELAALLGPVVSLVAGIVIARTVGATGRGQIIVILTWAQVAGWAGGLSIDKAIVARDAIGGRRVTVPVGAGLSALLVAGLLAALTSILVSGLLEGSPMLRAALFVCVLGTVAVDARAATLLHQDRWQTYAALRFAQPLTYFGGCCVAAALTAHRPELGIGAFIVASCASLWLPAIFIGGAPRPTVRWPSIAHVRALFAFAGAYHVGSVLYFVSIRIDIMMMSIRFTDSDVGIYAVASSAGQMVALLGSVSLVRGLTGRTGGANRLDRTGLAVAAGVAAMIAATVGLLVPIAYGSEFVAATLPAQILCAGGLLVYVTQGLNGQLAGAGRPWDTALVNVGGAATFVVLIPWMKTIYEVAAASATSSAVALSLAFFLIRRQPRAVSKVDPCTSESMLHRSGQDTQPELKPSHLGLLADSRKKSPTEPT